MISYFFECHNTVRNYCIKPKVTKKRIIPNDITPESFLLTFGGYVNRWLGSFLGFREWHAPDIRMLFGIATLRNEIDELTVLAPYRTDIISSMECKLG